MHPLKARNVHTPKRAALVLTGLWLLAFALLLPQVFIQRLEPLLQFQPEVAEQPIRMAYVCVEYFSQHSFNIAYSLFFYLVLYIGPVLIMCVTYGVIARKLWKGRRIGETPEDGRRLREKKKIVRMLVVIVVSFTVSWFPFFTYHVCLLWWPAQTYRVLLASIQLLGYSNSCTNPLVYCFMNEKFRNAVKTILCCRGKSAMMNGRSRSSRRSTQYTYTETSTNHANHMENRALVDSPTRKSTFL
jgi:MFS family permease